MPKFAYRIFRHGSEILLAISDAGIVGKTLRSQELEITVSREFYGGESCDESNVPPLVKSATIVNAIGKEIVELLSSKGFLNGENVIMIGDVPHAQIISV